MPKAARITDTHSCPKHPNSTIVSGQTNVIVAGQPVARLSDTTSCQATIASGEASVIIGGAPAARQGDFTDHGGYITEGCASVLIGKPAAAECLSSDKPLVKSAGPVQEPPLTSSPTFEPTPPVESATLLEQVSQALENSPFEPLNDALLKGEDIFEHLGGAEALQLVNSSLNVVNMIHNAMGKDNPLSDWSNALNLLAPGQNALTQVGGLLALSGEEQCGGALTVLGQTVGGGKPMTLLASTARLLGEDKTASLCTLGSGKIDNVIQEVNTLLAEQETKTAVKKEPSPPDTQETIPQPSLTPNDDNNPFI